MAEEKAKWVSMFANDAVTASLAECYANIPYKENGKEVIGRYNLMTAISLEAKFTKTKTTIPILGKAGRGHKTTGWEGTGTATFHYNNSRFRRLMKRFKDNGEDVYFDIQIINKDPSNSSKIGSQSITLLNCNIDGGILAKFDADGEYLDETMDFTFEDFTINEYFKNLPGFKVSPAPNAEGE